MVIILECADLSALPPVSWSAPVYRRFQSGARFTALLKLILIPATFARFNEDRYEFV